MAFSIVIKRCFHPDLLWEVWDRSYSVMWFCCDLQPSETNIGFNPPNLLKVQFKVDDVCNCDVKILLSQFIMWTDNNKSAFYNLISPKIQYVGKVIIFQIAFDCDRRAWRHIVNYYFWSFCYLLFLVILFAQWVAFNLSVVAMMHHHFSLTACCSHFISST